ncbi:TetR/AcrR family transcriptional regulator [Aestuariicella hydrocarbonica]|uniref:TetR/AcrR family transcriptional regulator n=1 Tax=Pseudomaricurvus hydrocarbonicus TaxID=1470433 RepID=A0A9E5MK16_9GAMM|nr:TetR/AcrR family transcriptional regulator [Aestuariicella hydrocarbonica]NHO64762.1 TetR/AcrR family transcriptional regulator [Aestuariicella hydrocarbonica]
MAEAVIKKGKRPSKEQRIQSILQAAREVFELRGYEKATVAEIAEKIGVVEGTVFSYFSSKRLLVSKVMEEFYADITRKIEGGISGIDGARNKLFYVVWTHFTVVKENSAICAVILGESRGVEHTFSDELQDLNRRYSHVVGEIIEYGINEGAIAESTSVGLVRNVVFGTIEHYLWRMLDQGVEMNVDELAEELTSLIFNGIATKNKSSNKSEVEQLIGKLNKLL